jgi:hypothetical protein
LANVKTNNQTHLTKRRKTLNVQHGGFTPVYSLREQERLLLVAFERLSRLYERVNQLNVGQSNKGTKTKAP